MRLLFPSPPEAGPLTSQQPISKGRLCGEQGLRPTPWRGKSEALEVSLDVQADKTEGSERTALRVVNAFRFPGAGDLWTLKVKALPPSENPGLVLCLVLCVGVASSRESPGPK